MGAALPKKVSKLNIDIFRQRYALPPEIKVLLTQSRVREFVAEFGVDGVFLSFSGGKDSQVLAEIIKEMGPPYDRIELVFFDTHNEDKSVYEIVERYNATVISSPLLPQEVIEKVGYPLFNKRIAKIIEDIRRGSAYTTAEGAVNRKFIDEIKIKYAVFIDSPLRISDKCCNELKKKPSAAFSRRTGKHPIVATMAMDSRDRMRQYLNRGCNAFEGKIQSTPMGFWSKADVLWFIATRGLKIARCYKCGIMKGLITGVSTCKLYGKQQTGCLFCGFGKGLKFAYKILKLKCPEYYATLGRSD